MVAVLPYLYLYLRYCSFSLRCRLLPLTSCYQCARVKFGYIDRI
jgi:hypothetical protein